MSMFCHVCPDGHCWVEQDDGTVSPSYGYGGTRITWPGYDPRTCPEPRRRDRQYKCPTCGTRNYSGTCPGPRHDLAAYLDSQCEPPAPVCLKAPVATFQWVDHNRHRKHERSGWVDITSRQLVLVGPAAAEWEQPADAILAIERGEL